MALLQRSRILANQRLDLPDYNKIEDFVCADFSAIHKNLWSDENFVFTGFKATGLGTNTLSVALAGSTALVGADDGMLYIGAPTLNALQTSTLTPNARNYIEIFIDQDSGGADSRAFWDQTAGGGEGGEFSQIVDTFLFSKASFAINTSNFTGDANKVQLCTVDVDNSGIITLIVDHRPMFFRLGRPSNAGYTFNWINGRTAEDSINPSYDDPDKHIQSIKDMFDALMDSVREIKGTTYWYEPPFISLTNTFQSTGLSVLTAASSTGKFSWTGTQLKITDDDVTPNPSDPIAHIRFFNLTENVSLLRDDINISDGDVLWVELPDPITNIQYDTVGASTTNYRVSPRGAVALNDNVYWLAYVEGTRIFLRGLGELEIGEERQINDESATALKTWLGFDPEIATSVPYPFFPNSLIFTEIFSPADHLVRSIGVNANNINILATMLDENSYEETIELVSGAPANALELTGPIAPGTNITLPPDSRDASSAQEYVVGDGVLHLYHDGGFLVRGRDFNEVGTVGTLSDTIEILRSLEVGEVLTFRMDSLGGFSVGSSGGGDVINASNIGGGPGTIFKQKTAGNLELRTLTAGAGISIVLSGDQIIISTTGGAPTPYFRNDITGQNTALINTGGPYNLGTDKLEVYRGGVLMVNTLTLGVAEDRYQESTNTTVSLDVAAPAAPGEIFTFLNQSDTPAYKTISTGITGTLLTVPSYTTGNDSLRVFRNGIMMNRNGHGAAEDQYSESSATTITLTQSATTSEIFTFINGPIPASREDQSGLTGTSITLANSYVVGSNELLVYRNGSLIYNSATLGNPPDRYSETTSNSITLTEAALSTEFFTFLIK